jgi:hypothetical protein
MRYFTIITGLQIGHVIYIFRLNFTDKHKNVALSENKQNWRTSLDSFPTIDADHNTYQAGGQCYDFDIKKIEHIGRF